MQKNATHIAYNQDRLALDTNERAMNCRQELDATYVLTTYKVCGFDRCIETPIQYNSTLMLVAHEAHSALGAIRE